MPPTPPTQTPPFEDYWRERGGWLTQTAVVLAGNAQEGADVAQAVAERALRSWDKIQTLDHPDAYLRRMVVNEFLSTRRALRRMIFVESVPDALDHVDQVDQAQQHADRASILGELRHLPRAQRTAIALRYWEGLSVAEIADLMNCRETSVRGYLHRGLRRLRISLDPHTDPAQDPTYGAHHAHA